MLAMHCDEPQRGNCQSTAIHTSFEYLNSYSECRGDLWDGLVLISSAAASSSSTHLDNTPLGIFSVDDVKSRQHAHRPVGPV